MITNRSIIPCIPKWTKQIIWFTRDVMTSSHVSLEHAHLLEHTVTLRTRNFLGRMGIRRVCGKCEVTRPQGWDTNTDIRCIFSHGFKAKTSSTSLQCLLYSGLLSLDLCRRRRNVKTIEKISGGFMSQAYRRLGHYTMIYVNHVGHVQKILCG